MKRTWIVGILLVGIISMITVTTTYSRFVIKDSVSGSLTVPEDNYCINNGFTKLSDCMLVMDSAASSVEDAIATISKRQADFTITEPKFIYQQQIEENLSGTSIVSTTSAIYIFTEAPTMNQTTGYFTFPTSSGKLTTISDDYVSTAEQTYYTCMNQTSNGNCFTVYTIDGYTSSTSNGVTTYRITNTDRYTSKVVDTAASNPGLYAAEDDLGTSYYYRGNVTNNYVSYAGYIWRIVRRNGDGSIRLVYSGTSTSDTGSNTSIANSSNSRTTPFNKEYRDFAYLGYQYGLNLTLKETTSTLTYSNIAASSNYYYADSYSCDDETKQCRLTGNKISGTWASQNNTILNGNDANGNTPYKYTCWSTSENGTCPIISEIQNTVSLNGEVHPTQARVKYIGYLSTSYESTYQDDVDSNIKTEIDYWYANNIATGQDENGNYYSDYLADVPFCNDRSVTSGDGETLNTTTLYGAYNRNASHKTPSLQCPREEDEFSVSNGKLTYPVALLTIDEVAMAGGVNGQKNSLFYLYTGQSYWTLSPYHFASWSAAAHVWYVNSDGHLSAHWVNQTWLGVRPVVNLSSDILISGGTGTANNPYVVTLQEN